MGVTAHKDLQTLQIGLPPSPPQLLNIYQPPQLGVDVASQIVQMILVQTRFQNAHLDIPGATRGRELETTGTDPRPLGALELQGVGGSSFPPDKAGGARSSPSLQGGSWDRCLWTLCT